MPNKRVQRTRSASLRSPLTRHPLGAMKGQLGAIVTLAFVAACAHSSKASLYVRVAYLPELGSRFVPPEPAIALVSRGRTRQTFGVVFQGSQLNVMVDAADNRVVNISTTDTRFSTPEGARVGDSVSSITALAGHWIEAQQSYLLVSGWRADFNSAHVVDQLERDVSNGA